MVGANLNQYYNLKYIENLSPFILRLTRDFYGSLTECCRAPRVESQVGGSDEAKEVVFAVTEARLDLRAGPVTEGRGFRETSRLRAGGGPLGERLMRPAKPPAPQRRGSARKPLAGG